MNKTPKLRFKEFSGDWESKKLGSCVEINSGGSPTDMLDENGTIPYFKVEQLNNSSKYQVNTPYRISNNKKVIRSGSIIFPKRGAAIMLNKIRILAQDSFMDTNLMTLTVKEALIDNEFLYTYLLKENLSKLADTTSIPQINNKHIEPYEIKMPSKEEQEKIASFFSLIDDKISLQGEKVEMLKSYKNGMMQKIFSRELRFKDDDGRDYPEWKEKKLGDIANLTSSKRVFASDYVDEGIPFYRGKEITELKQNKQPKDVLYITQERYDDIKDKFGIPLKGDLLLTAVGTLGNSYVISDDKPFYFKDGNLIWFKDITENVDFLNFILTSVKGQKKIIDSAIGSTQKALTIVELNKLKYKFPSLDEQIKIATFLSSLEEKVLKEQEKLDSLNEYKKGLLQQMFV